MVVRSTAGNVATGPTAKSPTSTAALRARLEQNERDITNLQKNRNPQSFQMHQLANTQPMSKVIDQQFPMFDKQSGQYVPSYVSVLRNDVGSSFIEIVGSQITIQSGGCGPILLTGPGLNVDTILDVQFTATFHQEAVFDAEALFSGSQIVMAALPTSNSGLSSGRLWRSGNTVMIV